MFVPQGGGVLQPYVQAGTLGANLLTSQSGEKMPVAGSGGGAGAKLDGSSGVQLNSNTSSAVREAAMQAMQNVARNWNR